MGYDLFFEVVLLGRGGQGVVTSSTILADAFIRDGKYVQAFPEFGPERAGAPVKAYVRVSDQPIEVYTPVEQADAAIVFDVNLLKKQPMNRLLKAGGMLVLNAEQGSFTEDGAGYRICKIPATLIAKSLGKPLSIGIALLGAFSAISRVVPLQRVSEAVSERLSGEDVKVLERGFSGAVAVATV
ncbi:MAG: 2-oxoacid:acceptor oxidoreductase family protein [Nitrososphaerota archaeon]